MSTEVAEAIRQTRRTLAEKTWVPHMPIRDSECCLVTAAPKWRRGGSLGLWLALRRTADTTNCGVWNDRQTDVGAVLGMTLEALIAELCKAAL